MSECQGLHPYGFHYGCGCKKDARGLGPAMVERMDAELKLTARRVNELEAEVERLRVYLRELADALDSYIDHPEDQRTEARQIRRMIGEGE